MYVSQAEKKYELFFQIVSTVTELEDREYYRKTPGSSLVCHENNQKQQSRTEGMQQFITANLKG